MTIGHTTIYLRGKKVCQRQKEIDSDRFIITHMKKRGPRCARDGACSLRGPPEVSADLPFSPADQFRSRDGMKSVVVRALVPLIPSVLATRTREVSVHQWDAILVEQGSK